MKKRINTQKHKLEISARIQQQKLLQNATSSLWFESRSGHMWESQVLLSDDLVFSGFRPPLMNDRLNISEIILKGP